MQKLVIYKSYPIFFITTTNMPTKGKLIKEATVKASQAIDANPRLIGTAAIAKFQVLSINGLLVGLSSK